MLCLSVQATAAFAQQQPPTTIYTEDFQNDQAANIASIIKVDAYHGAAAETYTASPAWLTNCNGWLSAWNQNANPATATANGECNNQDAWNKVQQLAETLGMLNGGTTGTGGTARDNLAVSAYTQTNPPGAPNNIEIQSSQIPLSGSDRFLVFGADVAAVNCDIAAHPKLQFYAVDASDNAVAAGGEVDGCNGTSFTAEAIGASPATTVKAGHISGSAILVSGASTSIRVNNTSFTGGGNDHAFDNLVIQDVTPTLSKAFGTSTTSPDTAVALTFTVTNTTDNLQKQGWSFIDNLPAGLMIADANVDTTCSGTTVTVTPGGSTVTIADGNLPAGPSCTITVNVVASAPGSYTNGASNISSPIGMNLPTAPATLIVGGGADLAIAKTGSATAQAGGALSWTLTVTNSGTSPSSGFVVTDTLPAGVTNIASSTAGCTVSGSTVTCTGGALAVAASATITITGNAPDPFTACITNAASVLGNEADPSSANDSASFQTCPQASPASITTAKTLTAINGAPPAAGQPVNAGDVLTYTITSTNAGQVAGPTTLTETVPASTTYTGPDAGAWSGCAPGAANPAACTTVQNVPANGSTSTTFTVSVDKPLASDIRSIANVVRSSADAACAACTMTVPVAPAQPGAEPVPAPVNSTWMLALLGLGLLVVGGGIAYKPSR